MALAAGLTPLRSRILRYRQSSLLRRSVKNSIYNTLDYALLPALWLITARFFTSSLGIDRYGIWMLTNTIMGIGGAMSFGLSDATIKFVAQYRALDDLKSIQAVIRTSLTVYTLLGGVTAIGLIPLAPLLVGKVFHVDPANTALAIAAIRLGGFGLLIRFIDSVFLSALQGFERYDLNARVSMVVNVATVGLNVISVLRGQGLITVLETVILLQFAGAIVKIFCLRPLMGAHWNVLPMIHMSTLREIFGFGFYSWIQTLGGLFLGQSDRFLVASILNTRSLAYYALCLQVAQQLQSILSRAMAFLFPVASVARQTGDTHKLRQYYFKGLMFTTTAGIVVGLPVFLLAPGILSIWLGPAFAASATGALRVLVVSASVIATSIVPHYYMNGTGFVRMNAINSVASGLLVGAAALLLVPYFGITGAAWSRLATVPVSIVARTILHHRVLKDTRWYGGIVTLVPVLLCYFVATLFLMGFGDPAIVKLLVLVPAAAACALLALLLVVICMRVVPVEA